MGSRNIVFKETGIVAIGQAVGTLLLIGAYALLERLDRTVVLGALVGDLIALGNFFSMAVIASLAADRAERQDVQGGQKLIQSSYPLRLLAMAVVLILCAKSGWFDLIALVVPLIFVRPTLTLAEFFRKKGA